MITTKSDLGLWLRQLRTTAGMTQAEAGAAIGGVEARSIRRWETGGDVPGGLVLLRLIDAYGIRIPGVPASTPRAVNAELSEIRQQLELLRLDLVSRAESSVIVRLLEPLARLTAEQPIPGPALRELIQSVVAEVRETAALLL